MSGQSVAVPRQIGIYPMVRLGSVAKVQSGLTLDAGKAVMNPTVSRPYLRVANVQDGWVDLTEMKEVDVPRALAHRWELRPGDVLMTEGGDADKLGRGTVWRGEIPGCLHQNHIFAVRPGRELHPDYLGFLTQTSYARAYFEATSSKTTGIASTSTSKISSFRIPLPPVQDQVCIAHFLHAGTARIDALITKKRHLNELLLDRRSAVASDAVSGRFNSHASLVSSSLPWLDERPNHWKEVLLRLVARLGSGHTPSRDHPEWWVDCTIPWITTGEVHRLRSDRVEYIESTRERISEVGLANSSAELHPAATVVLCRTASAGYSGIMRTSMATSQDFATWTCGPLLRPRFLLLCLRAMRRDLLGRLAMGSTHQTIYMPDIRSIRIPLPPPSEQDEIVDAAWSRFMKIDRLATAVERQVDLLEERRQALITAAVTGELQIPERVAS